MTYKAAKLLIASGNYEYEQMASNLSLFLLTKRITQDQYTELIGLMDTQKSTM